MKNYISLLLLIIFLMSIPVISFAEDFADVNESHFAYYSINKLRDLGITNGIGDNIFGLGKPVKRSEFAAMLVRLLELEIITPATGSFQDNLDSSKWYYNIIETAAKNNMINTENEYFRPEEYITRSEMAEMIVRSLGYYKLSEKLNNHESYFSDVKNNIGIITIAKDLGIISGMGDGTFAPDNKALREHAAAMMIRMYDKLNMPINNINAFYAINSYSQKEYIKDLENVSFGWSELEYINADKGFTITTSNNQGFYIPDGYEELLEISDSYGTKKNLMIFASNVYHGNLNTNLLDYFLSSKEQTNNVIDDIIELLTNNKLQGMDGVVIDFELLKDNSKQNLNIFIKQLKTRLDLIDKQLIVAVHPITKGVHYDGYDYRFLANTADSIILMAHDYSNKVLSTEEMELGFVDTPLTPFDKVYYSLKEIADPEKGVEDLDKVFVQFSFDSLQWKKQDGKVINNSAYRPSYDLIYKRLLDKSTLINYSVISQNPYAKYYNTEDNTENIIWYENTQSINSKINLAKMFGFNNFSLWRLGTIPNYQEKELDVWNEILKLKK